MNLFEHAEYQARLGMSLALAKANRHDPDWGEHAYAFLVEFAKHHRLFISEDVSDATKQIEDFPQPTSLKAWGQIYRRAAKARIIWKRDHNGKSRLRHNSPCPTWESLVFEVQE